MPTEFPVSPFQWIQFGEDARPVDAAAFTQLDDLLSRTQATDLVVMSHGWKNEWPQALALYTELWGNTVAALRRDPARIVLAGVLWPSVTRRSFDERPVVAATGGGLAVAHPLAPASADRVLEEAIADYLEGAVDPDFAARARAAADALASTGARALVKEVVTALPSGDQEFAAELDPLRIRAQDAPATVLQALTPALRPAASSGGGLAAGAPGGGGLAGGSAAVARFLNNANYYRMKARAGDCGAALGPKLAASQAVRDVRLHFVGHSFGARLVTAAAASHGQAGGRAASLTLLQGAFSHHALAPNHNGRPGAFAEARDAVATIAITHTHNDSACHVAYAWASLAAGQTASDIGGAGSPFGAMGANGAQKVQVTAHEDEPGSPATAPRPGVNNYHATGWIKGADAHGDVRNAVVGRLLASVIDAG